MADEYAADFEARQALMGLIVRVVEEIRFGLRPVDVDEIVRLAWAWEDVNGGDTPSEAVLRLSKME